MGYPSNWVRKVLLAARLIFYLIDRVYERRPCDGLRESSQAIQIVTYTPLYPPPTAELHGERVRVDCR